MFSAVIPKSEQEILGDLDSLDQGLFKISKMKSDLMNAEILVNHRLNLIIGDPSVIRYSAAIADMDEKKRDNILHKLETVKPVIQYSSPK